MTTQEPPSVIARLRRRLGRRVRDHAPRTPASEPRRGLGEPPARAIENADDAELDTLRGELVRELDRMADTHKGPSCLRRI
jgi:hypothetical protein